VLSVSGSLPGQLLYPNPLVPSVKSTRRERSSELRPMTAVHESGIPILDPKVVQTLGLIFRGGLFPLEGAGPSGLSALPFGANK